MNTLIEGETVAVIKMTRHEITLAKVLQLKNRPARGWGDAGRVSNHDPGRLS